jgi:chemotaxis regulatin CheY-phosphate phosphatase CheZ
MTLTRRDDFDAGNQMTNKTSLAGSLQELLGSVVGNSFIYLSEMESDLLQINLLLMEAINKLGDNVIEIGQSVRYQQQIVKQLAMAGNNSPFELERLEKLGQSVDDKVRSVVIAMQFQDMTSQLLDKVLSRVTGLQKMVEDMEKLASEVSRAESDGDVRMMIRAAGAEMTSQRHELEKSHIDRVSQKHMESGSIELF